MQISFDNNQTTFKQIKLNEIEKRTAKDLIYRYQKANSLYDSSNLKGQIFDVFKHHLQSEAELKGNNIAWQVGQFAKEIYLKFFLTLRNFRFTDIKFEDLINELNNFGEKDFVPNEIHKGKLDNLNVYNFNENILNISRVLKIPTNKYIENIWYNPDRDIPSMEKISNDIKLTSELLGVDSE